MSPPDASQFCWLTRFPRVSGDEPGQSLEATATIKFSPRERG